MSRSIRTMLVASVLTLLCTAMVGAAQFTITLTNGTTFETRYRPVEVDWDENVVLLNTDRGNLIALPKDEIADVSSSAEVRGFGYQVDTTTIYLGFSPNDLVSQDEEGNETSDYELPDVSAAQSYSLGQFVNVTQAGSEPTGGVPLYAASEND